MFCVLCRIRGPDLSPKHGKILTVGIAFSPQSGDSMEFEDRNSFEIQKVVEHILAIATNGLEWARDRETEQLDEERDFVEWGPGDKNDEGYLIEELAEPLPTHLSIIKTVLLLQSERVGSDEENIARFKELLTAGKITNPFVFNVVAACCDFYSLGWMARHIAGRPPFRHYHAAQRVAFPLVDRNGELEESSVIAR
jgi:hypothetical protein